MAFGLGAGACFYYVALDEESPSRFTNGRTARLEEQFVELTGAALELTHRRRPRPRLGARRASSSTRAGPAILLTDLYHLDHYGKSAHFPGHAVVLAGYDDEVAYLSDTAFEELQTTRLENLAARPPRQAAGLPARRPHVPPSRRRGARATCELRFRRRSTAARGG